MILVVAPKTDAHAAAVMRRLAFKGAQARMLDVAEIPTARGLTASVGFRHKGRYDPASIRLGDLDLLEVEAVWYRRVGWPLVDARMAQRDRAFAAGETQAALLSAAEILDDRAFAVNPVRASLMSERGAAKLYALEVAQECGLRVPRTLVTSDPKEAAAFLAIAEGGAIYKPFMAPLVEDKLEDGRAKKRTLFTNKLDASALEAIDGVRAAPCLFQELVPKAVEIRATIMGHRVFATEIRSQETEKGRDDFRRAYGELSYAPHALPKEIEGALLGVLQGLALYFGCADLILTPEGEYVFLEVNQQGQWLWLEEQTGQPLLAAFCEMLMQARPAFSFDAGVHAPGIFPEAP